MFQRSIFMFGLALAVSGCRGDHTADTTSVDTTDTDTDTDTGTGTEDTGTEDTGTGTEDTGTDIIDTGTLPPVDLAPEGFAFCAAGGAVSGATVNGRICLGPMDVGASGTIVGADATWQAGPIYVLAP